MLFLKADLPIQDYGTAYVGLGRPMTLVSSPGATITLQLPSGGSIPTSAVYNSGGPLDGVPAGAPWDIPFVDHWRQLCVQNNATTGVRSTYVDGVLIGTSGASLNSVTAGTVVTVGAACPMALCELLVWDGATMTPADMVQTCHAHARNHRGVTWFHGGSASSGTLASPRSPRALRRRVRAAYSWSCPRP